ncbi:MAG: hypothetical protein Q9184_004287, partial [Pyrenodesmia sp. 2 TL-2023]
MAISQRGGSSAAPLQDLVEEHRNRVAHFAMRIHGSYSILYPAYAKTWHDLGIARQEIYDLRTRHQRQNQQISDQAIAASGSCRWPTPSELHRSLKELIGNYAKDSMEWAQKKDELNATIEQLQVERRHQKSQTSALKAEVAVQDSEVERLQRAGEGLQEQLETARAAQEELVTQLSTERRRVESTKGELTARESTIQRLRRELLERKQEVAAVRQERSQLEDESKKQERTIQTLSQELIEQRRETDGHKKAKSSLDRTHQGLQGRFKEAEQSLAKVESDNKEFQERCRRLEAECQQPMLEIHQRCAEQMLELHKASLQRETGTGRPFVMAMIDADGYIFRKDLLQSSETGGWKAADDLAQAVRTSLSKEDLGLDDVNIMAWAFADFEQVAIYLYNNNHITEDMQLYRFARGFNARRSLFHFDDVGYGKERADHKLKEKMRFHMQMPQCKQVFLACGHDSGYAAWLQDFASEPADKSRITLMAHPNMHQDVLKLGFR